MLLQSFVEVGTKKPKYELADIFREHGEAYRRQYYTTYKQRKVMQDIINCRTAALGGYIEQCDACGRLRAHYCSCKNRDCPKCGAWEKAQWLARLETKLLPIPYFHVIFTVDHRIIPLARVYPWRIYNLLIRTATKILRGYGQKYLGGEIGITMVLHTWGQTMNMHPHVHCIVTGGALQETEEGPRWKSSNEKFLFPVKKLSRDFRDEFCKGLKRLWRDETASATGPDLVKLEQVDIAKLVTQMRSKRWEVFIKPAPQDPRKLCDYLGQYTQRSAISNYRIVGISGGQVSFKYYDNREDGAEKVMTLDAIEFIRRFLQHVLPSGFHRIRHCGLHHSSKRGALELIRGQLGLAPELPEPPELELHEWIESVTGQDPRVCPFCGEGRMFLRAEFGSVTGLKAKLLSILGLPLLGRLGKVMG
ncbi:MAG: IS91 family transposase [Planctomycetota bacterium]|nr:MAG: IS91 family transposase [Planctomycetota bacterium]